MAKFRAARKLWARVEQACGLTPKPVMITAETAWRMMTRRDPYVNMLRTTIAVAAAGFGGADAITVLPHTAPLGLPDAFARRVARNTQLVLLEELNLARVGDPAAGSGALEAMTARTLHRGMGGLPRDRAGGGVWAALETGLIQRHAAAVRAERERAVARRNDILTGTNEYPDINETVPAVLDVAPACCRKTTRQSPTAALPRIRLAEPFEQLRDASDKILGRRPARGRKSSSPISASLPTSTPARTSPRTSSRPAASKRSVARTAPPRSPQRSTRQAPRSPACAASDKTYDSEAEAAAAALKAAGARHLYLAGRPGAKEETLRAAGVQTFIHEVAMSWRRCKPPTIF